MSTAGPRSDGGQPDPVRPVSKLFTTKCLTMATTCPWTPRTYAAPRPPARYRSSPDGRHTRQLSGLPAGGTGDGGGWPAGPQFPTGRAGQPDHAGNAGWNGGLDGQVLLGLAPVPLDGAASRLQPRRSPSQPAARPRRDEHSSVAGLERRDPADDPVDPVRDGTQRVVVETGHLPWVDRAVGQHSIPAFPDRGGTHRDGVQP